MPEILRCCMEYSSIDYTNSTLYQAMAYSSNTWMNMTISMEDAHSMYRCFNPLNMDTSDGDYISAFIVTFHCSTTDL